MAASGFSHFSSHSTKQIIVTLVELQATRWLDLDSNFLNRLATLDKNGSAEVCRLRTMVCQRFADRLDEDSNDGIVFVEYQGTYIEIDNDFHLIRALETGNLFYARSYEQLNKFQLQNKSFVLIYPENSTQKTYYHIQNHERNQTLESHDQPNDQSDSVDDQSENSLKLSEEKDKIIKESNEQINQNSIRSNIDSLNHQNEYLVDSHSNNDKSSAPTQSQNHNVSQSQSVSKLSNDIHSVSSQHHNTHSNHIEANTNNRSFESSQIHGNHSSLHQKASNDMTNNVEVQNRSQLHNYQHSVPSANLSENVLRNNTTQSEMFPPTVEQINNNFKEILNTDHNKNVLSNNQADQRLTNSPNYNNQQQTQPNVQSGTQRKLPDFSHLTPPSQFRSEMSAVLSHETTHSKEKNTTFHPENHNQNQVKTSSKPTDISNSLPNISPLEQQAQFNNPQPMYQSMTNMPNTGNREMMMNPPPAATSTSFGPPPMSSDPYYQSNFQNMMYGMPPNASSFPNNNFMPPNQMMNNNNIPNLNQNYPAPQGSIPPNTGFNYFQNQ